MNLSALFIRKPVMTVLVTITLIALGIGAYKHLPVASMPNVSYPVVTVNTAYQGASAETIAKLISQPIEQEVIAIQGLMSVYSQSFTGQSTVIATFSMDRTMDGVVQDILNAIQQSQANLPKDLPAPPSYSKVNPSDQPMIYVTLTSDTLTAADIYVQGAQIVQNALQMIEGVGQVQIFGAEPAVRVKVDTQKLSYLGLSLSDVSYAVNASNPNLPAGKIDGPTVSFTLDPTGDRLCAADYKPTIVTYKDGAPLRLEDIAEVVDDLEARDIMTRYWQRGSDTTSNAIIIAVIREASANTVKVSDDIQAALKELRNEIPGSIGLSVLYDQSISVVASIDDVQETLLIAFILVVLVIFIFLARPTDTLIPVVALPMSVVMTLIFMKLLGFSLDNLSLLAIMLAIGFVVDDAIVVLENTVRHVEHGQKPIDAAINGAKEIGTTVLSMSITLMAVFIPLIFMPGVMGLMLREFSITIVLAILSSAIVSLTLSPLMCSYFIKSDSLTSKTAFERWADHMTETMIAHYSKLLTWFIAHKKTAIFIWASCIAGTFYIGGLLPKSFLPPGDSGALYGSFVAENGTSPARMKELQSELEDVMQSNPYVVRTYTVTGVTTILTGNQGMLFAALCPKSERPDIQIICNQVNQAMAQQVPGVRAGLAPIPMISFNTGSNTNTSGAAGTQYQFEISGNITLDETYEYATQLYNEVKKIPGIVHPICELDNDNSQITIEILRDQASALGVTAMAIERALDEAYANYIASYIRTPINLFWVIVESADKDRTWPRDLNSIYVQSQMGFQVPLLSVVNPVVSLGPSMIKHKNQQNMAMVSFALGEDMALGPATEAITKIANQVLPPTVLAEFSGDAATFKQTTQDMAFLLVVAIFTMYIVLGILYESFIQPLTILSTLPVAGFGGVLTLFIFQQDFSFYATVGFFMLLGIVNKNGIMLVDFANLRLEQEHCPYEQAIYEAAQARFRPILMTGLAAIMGAMPMALGYGADGKGRMPMGLMVVGGLIFSQFVTLLVTPVIYIYFEKMRDWANHHLKRG